MFVLRCTRKLLRRMGEPLVASEVPRSSGRLGDWTANLVMVGRQPLVLAVSSVTLLPVLLPAAPFKTLSSRLPQAVGQVLGALRGDPGKLASEVTAMSECVVAPTNDRRALGMLNDFDRLLQAYFDGSPLLDIALHVADAPCSPLKMASPRDATIALFRQVGADPTRPMLALVKG